MLGARNRGLRPSLGVIDAWVNDDGWGRRVRYSRPARESLAERGPSVEFSDGTMGVGPNGWTVYASYLGRSRSESEPYAYVLVHGLIS